MIKIQSYNTEWPKLFQQEKQRLLVDIKPWVIDIEHVGSTSVPGMIAKPTIDMCMIVTSLQIADKYIINALKNLNYNYLPELEKNIPDRRYLQYLDANGEHLFHIHIVEQNSQRQQDYLVFRDYLINHPDAVQKYSELKYKLVKLFAKDREAYTNAKADFIKSLHEKAKINMCN